MYRLFLSATLRVSFITVTLMAIVLGSTAAYFIHRIYDEQAATLASRTAVAVAFREASDLSVTPEYLESIAGSDSVKVTYANGQTVIVEGDSPGPEFLATRVDPLGEFSVTAGINQREFYIALGIVLGIVIIVSFISLGWPTAWPIGSHAESIDRSAISPRTPKPSAAVDMCARPNRLGSTRWTGSRACWTIAELGCVRCSKPSVGPPGR